MASLKSALICISVGLVTACGGSSSEPRIAGSPAAIAKTGDNQLADPGTAVTVPPSVKVTDSVGTPVSGATVVFSVGDGLGTVTGATPITNSAGVAAVGSWKLGPQPGVTNTLLVTVGNIAETFTATTTGTNPCTLQVAYTIGTTANGELSTADCLDSGGYYTDYFQTAVPSAGGYLFGETSTAVDAYLILYDRNGVPIGVNDDDFYTHAQDSRLKALLPPATFVLAASSYDPKAVGTYNLTSTPTSTSIDNCEDDFIMRGVTVAETLTATDCVNSGFYSDDLYIFLAAGQSVTVTMSSTDFDAFLEMYSLSGTTVTTVASNDNKDSTTTDAQVTFTATTSDFYLIAPTTKVSGALGAYTLVVQ